MCFVDGLNALYGIIYGILGVVVIKQITSHWPSFQAQKAVSLKGLLMTSFYLTFNF